MTDYRYPRRLQITVGGDKITYTAQASIHRTLIIRAPGLVPFEARDIRAARAQLKMAYQGK